MSEFRPIDAPNLGIPYQSAGIGHGRTQCKMANVGLRAIGVAFFSRKNIMCRDMPRWIREQIIHSTR